jgi:hypothetical protein
MLEQVLDFIHNYFIAKVYRGKFEIKNGKLVDFSLMNGQYYKIVGSIFNDQVWQYNSEQLTDETFVGEVWAMAVPPTLIALISEIEAWNNKYGGVDGATMSPYASESFGGYSYTKASAQGKDGSAKATYDWRDMFGSRLNRWRKLA